MRRPFLLLASAALAVGLVLSGSSAVGSASAATIASTTRCSDGVANTGGLGLICSVTIVNTITSGGGSAKVTLIECHGAAGAPKASCKTTVRILNRPVTVVNQCNSSINGGGGTLRCSVRVTNNFVNSNPGATAATVNQCVGSGGGITTGCDPFPATTTGARITQCNGSANGGTLVGLTCTATGTKSARLPVTINQCNGSANGGGSLVICSANVQNRRTTTTGGSTTAGASAPPTDTEASSTGAAAGLPIATLLLLTLFTVVVALGTARTRVRRPD